MANLRSGFLPKAFVPDRIATPPLNQNSRLRQYNQSEGRLQNTAPPALVLRETFASGQEAVGTALLLAGTSVMACDFASMTIR